ncbi:CRISPR-associated protein Cas5 [Runella sp.]|uniref:CRISPR-associated protein Cas5 n=1 Tax=Runella sp. TaxID=1960881 RepID=UPI0030181312
MQETLISFDLKADFGVFKKPDVNEGLQPTFNMLHKPALLGILGAIAGLPGYQKRGTFPVYYQELRDLKIGIQPLDHEKGNFTKTVVKYTNTVGYANADGNLIVTEQTLRKPAYRCYLLLDLDNPIQARLHDQVRAGEAEYLPYLGKNECSAWWEKEDVVDYKFFPFEMQSDFRISSLFIRDQSVRSQWVKPKFSPSARSVLNAASFLYFERLPLMFRHDESMKFVQYELADFAFTDWVLQKDSSISDLFKIQADQESEPAIIQLF